MRYKLLTILVFISATTYSQGITGIWKGQVQLPDSIMHLEISILTRKDSIITARISKPRQLFLHIFSGNRGYADSIHLTLKEYGLSFNGKQTDNKNQLQGAFTVNGKSYPLDMFRGEPIYRLQEPKAPFPYSSEEVFWTNPNDGVKLAGTLTIPDVEGIYPAVILISGSTPNNRDVENNYHKSFLVLADYLTQNGMAVLRYDDRGVGKSTGNFDESTAADFAQDVLAGFRYLSTRKEINPKSIGLIGHSEGGIVATIAASAEKSIGFVVLLASPGVSGQEIRDAQSEAFLALGESSKENQELGRKIRAKRDQYMEKGMSRDALLDTLRLFKKEYISIQQQQPANANADVKVIAMAHEVLFSYIIRSLLSPHTLFLEKSVPSVYLEKVSCPVLSLNGSKDQQVAAKPNQEAIRTALSKGGNTHFKILELEGLNHAFQECTTGSIEESIKIEQTFSPKALTEISTWILGQATLQTPTLTPKQ